MTTRANNHSIGACGSSEHLSRRAALGMAGAGLSWLTPMARALGGGDELSYMREPPRSVIIVWLQGGPSQLDTFDPHPNTKIGGDVKTIKTATKGVEIAAAYERLATVMDEFSLIRSVVSREGDHERATYNAKTGFRPDPTLVHPALGSVLCHQLTDRHVEIPRHFSILPGQWPARAGYLGGQYDAFKVYDPGKRVADVTSWVSDERQQRRLSGLEVAESAFAAGRRLDLETNVTLHRETVDRALRMMSSKQLAAFDLSDVPAAEREAYGDTAFGRGCLAAIRLIEVGVRCVEVTLDGWDTHVNNAEFCRQKASVLDPALSALICGLRNRGLLERTVVLCGGEFGRTPKINAAEGRDHWPHGFSMLVAGGGFRRGHALGATDPTGEKQQPADPVRIADVHATILHLLGINHERELMTPVGRPMALSRGRILHELIS